MLSWRQALKLMPIVFVVALGAALMALNESGATDDVSGTPATVRKNDVPSIKPGELRKQQRESVPEEAHGAKRETELQSGRTAASTGELKSGYVVSKLSETDLESFSMLGVTWRSGLAEDPSKALVEVRWRSEGEWSSWTELHLNPQPGEEGIPGTEPRWVGKANAAEVRVLSAEKTEPKGLKLVTVDPGRTPKLQDMAAGQPKIIKRKSWGARASASCGAPRYGNTTKGAVVHHTAGSNSYTKAQSASIVRSAQAYHMDGHGWCDIGYNFLIDKYGQIFEGRAGGTDKPVRGAHAGNWGVNEETMGVSLMGTFTNANPTAKMKTATVNLIAWRFDKYNRSAKGTFKAGGIKLNRISGHRNVVSTACPGDQVYKWLSAKNGLRNRVADVLNGLPRVSGFRVKSSSPSKFVINWKKLKGAKGYRIWYGTEADGSAATKVEVANGTTSKAITDVDPGTVYYVAIAGLDGSGTSGLYTKRIKAHVPLSAVKGLKLQRSSETSVKVKWNAHKGAVKYRLWYGLRADGTGGAKKIETSSTSTTLSNLKRGTRYYVSVAPIDGSQRSGVYTSRAAITTPDADDAVKQLTVKTVNASTLRVSWDSAPDVSKYRLWYGTESDGSGGATRVETSNTSVKLRDLVPETTYYVTVSKLRNGRAGPYTVRHIALMPRLPMVNNVRLSSSTASSLKVSWDAAPGASEYRLWYGTRADGKGAKKVETSGTSVKLSGLTPEEDYYVAVAPLSSGKRGPYTDREAMTTNELPMVNNVRLSSSTASSLKVSWDAAPGASEYRLWYGTRADGKGAKKVETSGTSVTLKDLEPSTNYYVSVATLHRIGHGPYTDRTKYTTTPFAVENFKLKSSHTSTMTLTWSEYPGATQYRIWYGMRADGAGGAKKIEPNGTSATLTNLDPSTTYWISIAPLSKNGKLAEYTQRVGYHTQTDGESSGKITGLHGISGTSSTLTIGWDAVPGASKYRVWYGVDPSGSPAKKIETKNPRVKISYLRPGTKYYLNIAPIDSHGKIGSYTPKVKFQTTPRVGNNTASVTQSDEVVFKGHGFGHGIGMSQYGAEGAARKGKKYRSILKKYYPGTDFATKSGNIRVWLTKDRNQTVKIRAKSGLTFKNPSKHVSLPTKIGGKHVKLWSIDVKKSQKTQSTLWYKVSNNWHRYSKVPAWTGEAEFGGTSIIRLVLPNNTTRDYRGKLRSSRPTPTTRRTVNVVSLENYTKGVVAAEMPASWHLEALKSQSVAARTYGVKHIRSQSYYDICDTTACQVYGGRTAETSSTNAAVNATKATILTYRGDPAMTMFSSSSGGYTSTGNQPYLKPVKDPWDNWPGNKNHTWKTTVKVRDIERAFPSIGALKDMSVRKRNGYGDYGGRVKLLEITGNKGSVSVSGNEARSVFGLKSNWFGF